MLPRRPALRRPPRTSAASILARRIVNRGIRAPYRRIQVSRLRPPISSRDLHELTQVISPSSLNSLSRPRRVKPEPLLSKQGPPAQRDGSLRNAVIKKETSRNPLVHPRPPHSSKASVHSNRQRSTRDAPKRSIADRRAVAPDPSDQPRKRPIRQHDPHLEPKQPPKLSSVRTRTPPPVKSVYRTEHRRKADAPGQQQTVEINLQPPPQPFSPRRRVEPNTTLWNDLDESEPKLENASWRHNRLHTTEERRRQRTQSHLPLRIEEIESARVHRSRSQERRHVRHQTNSARPYRSPLTKPSGHRSKRAVNYPIESLRRDSPRRNHRQDEQLSRDHSYNKRYDEPRRHTSDHRVRPDGQTRDRRTDRQGMRDSSPMVSKYYRNDRRGDAEVQPRRQHVKNDGRYHTEPRIRQNDRGGRRANEVTPSGPPPFRSFQSLSTYAEGGRSRTKRMDRRR